MMAVKKDVLIVIGSKSDQEFSDQAASTLEKLGIGSEQVISSAHRHPDKTVTLARNAADRGFKIIICMAGMAAHLPGVVAANTHLPVIGVPIPASLGGMDSLLSIAQMPPGIPVAAMSVGKAGAVNAAVLAARILGLSDPAIAEKHRSFRDSL